MVLIVSQSRIQKEVGDLRQGLAESRHLQRTYEQPSTVAYIAVTARNQKLGKDIAAARIKLNIAKLALKVKPFALRVFDLSNHSNPYS